MPADIADQQRGAATSAYENAGREISQAFDILNSNLTLAAGTLGVLLTVLGAGQLFGGSTKVGTISGIPRFTNVSVLLVGAAIPLIVRFFIRATIGYQQLLRFNLIQRGIWDFLSGQAEWSLALTVMNLYGQQWLSPDTLWKLARGSFKYGFAWVFAVAVAAFGWGLWTAPGETPRLVAGGFVVVALGYEWLSLRSAPYLKLPLQADLDKLQPLWPDRLSEQPGPRKRRLKRPALMVASYLVVAFLAGLAEHLLSL